jgi:hypothetical protein
MSLTATCAAGDPGFRTGETGDSIAPISAAFNCPCGKFKAMAPRRSQKGSDADRNIAVDMSRTCFHLKLLQ